ncbi:MAG TPA: acyl-CoA desaturase [Solirubrobacteraceae bacterium]|nr:acyl-CoA desaturase [Solirubrobacteraceae bacterium]
MSVHAGSIAETPPAEDVQGDLAVEGSPAGPSPEEIQEPVLENLDRAITGFITLAPALLLVLAGWQMWNHELRWRDVAIFVIMYVPIGLGVTVGFHRLLTHRSFNTSPALRGLLAVLGTMSIEGPVISWVADHRKHHAYSDRLGDPHSPHVDHGGGWRGSLRGLAHAHVGWLFDHQQRGARERFAPDLLADPVVAFVDRTFLLWSLLGLAIPGALGALIGGSVSAGLEGMLWGGAVRVFVLHHVTYSINSLCHFFGRRRFATDDHSRNLLWLAPFSFGEAWHNNHHAFPTSAFHGMGRRELDISGLVIAGLERAGLVWDVQRVSASKQAAKAL